MINLYPTLRMFQDALTSMKSWQSGPLVMQGMNDVCFTHATCTRLTVTYWRFLDIRWILAAHRDAGQEDSHAIRDAYNRWTLTVSFCRRRESDEKSQAQGCRNIIISHVKWTQDADFLLFLFVCVLSFAYECDVVSSLSSLKWPLVMLTERGRHEIDWEHLQSHQANARET